MTVVILANSLLLCASIEGLRCTPYILALTSLCGLFITLVLWRGYKEDAEAQEIISTIDHHFFGKITQRRKYWEASIDITGIGDDILVSGYNGNFPTAKNEESINWLIQSSEKICKEVLLGLKNYYEGFNKSIGSSIELSWQTIMLDEDDHLSFMIGFDVPDLKADSDFYSFTGFVQAGELVDLSIDH